MFEPVLTAHQMLRGQLGKTPGYDHFPDEVVESLKDREERERDWEPLLR